MATWLRSLPLGHKTKAIADYAKKNLVSGLILVSNSRSPEDLVETFGALFVHCSFVAPRSRVITNVTVFIRVLTTTGTTMSKPIARAVIYSLVENGASNTKRKSAAAANGDDAPPAKKGKGLKAGKKSSRKRGPRPPTAYLLFCRDKRNEFNGAGTLPTGKGEALKVLGAAWSSASNHVKARHVSYQLLACVCGLTRLFCSFSHALSLCEHLLQVQKACRPSQDRVRQHPGCPGTVKWAHSPRTMNLDLAAAPAACHASYGLRWVKLLSAGGKHCRRLLIVVPRGERVVGRRELTHINGVPQCTM